MKNLPRLLRETGIWAPCTVLIFHQFFSIKDWRSQIDWLNHYSGGLSFTYFSWKCLPFLARWSGNLTASGRLVVAFLSGCTAALLWEIGEFTSDLFLNTTIQQSIDETMMDILNGFLGTTATVLSLLFTMPPSKEDCAVAPVS